MNHSNSILSEFEKQLSLNPHLAPFERVASRVRALDNKQHDKLLALCERAFSDEAYRAIESARVAAAKVIVALVPESTQSIKRWISTESGKMIREVHFSLFCFLDEVPDLPGGEQFATEIPILIQQYLLCVKTESSSAAWMAGDLLGDHWKIDESLPILTRVAKEAKYVAGRVSAIDGLSQILRRLPEGDSNRESVYLLLNDIMINDRSESVRLSAKMAIKRRKS